MYGAAFFRLSGTKTKYNGHKNKEKIPGSASRAGSGHSSAIFTHVYIQHIWAVLPQFKYRWVHLIKTAFIAGQLSVALVYTVESKKLYIAIHQYALVAPKLKGHSAECETVRFKRQFKNLGTFS
jgi:hypothetical protein